MLLPRPNGLVTLLTDFGVHDPYVGLMKGMVKRSFERADLIDLCHEVPPQNVAVGAWFLGSAIDRFPKGTVHVVVVDPGVGTERRLLAVCARDSYWIAPDNGVLDAVLDDGDEKSEVRVVDLEAQGLSPESRTFHGRDLIGPLAGRLAGGRYGFRALGPRIQDPVRAQAITAGGARVIHVDHYGNLITNVVGADDIVSLTIGDDVFTRRDTYACGQDGEPFALVNSYGLFELAISGGSAARTLGIRVETPVVPNSA